MSILSFNNSATGQIGFVPNTFRISCNDSISKVTELDYINNIIKEGFSVTPQDNIEMMYGINNNSYGIFIPDFTSTGVTLVPWIATTADNSGIFTNGYFQAGLSGAPGYFTSYPSTINTGYLKLAASSNSANYSITITNSSFGQSSTINIPDPGASSASFVLNTSGSGQTIAGPLTVNPGNFFVTAGNITTGSSGNAGMVIVYPSTASKGTLIIEAMNNIGNTNTTITNSSMAQESVISIPDPGTATANFSVSPGNGSLILGNILNTNVYPVITVNITCTHTALASAGTVLLLASSGSHQYQILNISLNSGGTNFSGGSGNRLGEVTDGTTAYTLIPAATMQSLTNSFWGSTAVPAPASANSSTLTAAGANVVFQYAQGTTDYTAGSLLITLTAIQIA